MNESMDTLGKKMLVHRRNNPQEVSLPVVCSIGKTEEMQADYCVGEEGMTVDTYLEGLRKIFELRAAQGDGLVMVGICSCFFSLGSSHTKGPKSFAGLTGQDCPGDGVVVIATTRKWAKGILYTQPGVDFAKASKELPHERVSKAMEFLFSALPWTAQN